MSRITVRLESVRQWFPSGIDVPPLLAAFGRWLDAIPHGTLGYFDALAGESLDESFVRDPATLGALRARLGIFLLLPEGSRLALWDYGGPAPAVVWIGSEGGQRHVAATFEDFLVALSAGATGVSDLDDRDASAQRGALAEWLASQGVVAATNPAVTVPDFAAWFSSGGAIPAQSPGPTGPSSLDDLARAVETLCGRTSAEAEVADLLGRVGHWLGCVRLASPLTWVPRPLNIRSHEALHIADSDHRHDRNHRLGPRPALRRHRSLRNRAPRSRLSGC